MLSNGTGLPWGDCGDVHGADLRSPLSVVFMSFRLFEGFLFGQKKSPANNCLAHVTVGTLFWGWFWVLFNNAYKSEIPKASAEQNFWLLEWF